MVLIKFKSPNPKNKYSSIAFETYLIRYLSSFSIELPFGDSENIIYLNIDLNKPFPYKELYVLKGSNTRRLNNLLYYFGINELSPMIRLPIISVFSKLYNGKSPSSTKMRPFHYSLKKSLPIKLECKIPQSCDDLEISFNEDRDWIGSLVLTALLSGVHRHGIALRQVATQYLVLDMLLKGKIDHFFRNALAALILDTYLWIPSVYRVKKGAFNAELFYQIAALPLNIYTEILENILVNDNSVSKNNIFTNFVWSLNKWVFGIKNLPLNSPYDLVISLSQKISDFLKKFYKEFYTSNEDKISNLQETLLGLYHVYKFLKKEKTDKKLVVNEKKTLITVMTEQTTLLTLKMLHEYLGFKNVVILYTPETLFHRLLMNDIYNVLTKKSRRNTLGFSIKYYPIPGLEGEPIKQVIYAIVRKYKDDICCIHAQGNMMHFIALRSAIKKHGLQSVFFSYPGMK